MKRFSTIFCVAMLAGQAVAQSSDSGAAGVQGCSLEAAKAGKPLPFGCANALNLQAMIDTTADLSDAKMAPPPVGEPAVRAIGRHRDGQAVPLPTASNAEAQGAAGAR